MTENNASNGRGAEHMSDYWDLMLRVQQVMLRAGAASVTRIFDRDFAAVDPTAIGRAYLTLGLSMLRRPGDLAAMQASVLSNMAKLWTAGWAPNGQAARDRRFSGEAWESDPVARVSRDVHLAIEEATKEVLDRFPADSRERLSVEFYTRQILSALSPSNVLALNPEARARFLATRGRSLITGFSNLLDDIERGGGRLAISTADPDAFVVGRDLAATPGKVVFQNDLIQLIQYEPMTETQFKRPLLFVPAWINKFYILDMRPKNSLIRYALERGHTVFAISWVNPGPEHAGKSFESYMNEGVIAALDAIEKATGEKKVNTIGYCIGGILVNATLGHLAATGSDRIATSTTLVTMTDFKQVGEIGIFVDQVRLETMRAHLEKTGHLEEHQLRDMYAMLRENDLIWPFYIANYLMGDKPPAFDLLFWNSDSTRLPAAMFLWYLENIHIRNGLGTPGAITLNSTPIDLGKVKVPCFAIGTKDDHIAPWQSVYPATKVFGGDVRFVLGGSGHIAGVINPPGEKAKYGYWVRDDYPDDPEAWLDGAEYNAGSWWPVWAEWLESQDRAKKVPARVPGGGGLDVIESAPGSYVLAR
ncbi:PHA/PHB synthase family protein [Defluviimonas salinarum]|uniref:Class I poly(R)-hydroxyalkanoic acid synthase n=1 Tax=Defluviimonas salinarum TaxID=2992147 RepID=A0ABT3J8X0_9RHOB|nr:class I poly(R)-hydroxyalkanoic acid synthase [Defluviimonas salinarum]MCW3784126.1 class I poly(R)-hydroxyalkanoic acid synthase [Defluviimonas salinarum]